MLIRGHQVRFLSDWGTRGVGNTLTHHFLRNQFLPNPNG